MADKYEASVIKDNVTDSTDLVKQLQKMEDQIAKLSNEGPGDITSVGKDDPIHWRVVCFQQNIGIDVPLGMYEAANLAGITSTVTSGSSAQLFPYGEGIGDFEVVVNSSMHSYDTREYTEADFRCKKVIEDFYNETIHDSINQRVAETPIEKLAFATLPIYTVYSTSNYHTIFNSFYPSRDQAIAVLQKCLTNLTSHIYTYNIEFPVFQLIYRIEEDNYTYKTKLWNLFDYVEGVRYDGSYYVPVFSDDIVSSFTTMYDELSSSGALDLNIYVSGYTCIPQITWCQWFAVSSDNGRNLYDRYNQNFYFGDQVQNLKTQIGTSISGVSPTVDQYVLKSAYQSANDNYIAVKVFGSNFVTMENSTWQDTTTWSNEQIPTDYTWKCMINMPPQQSLINAVDVNPRNKQFKPYYLYVDVMQQASKAVYTY